MMETKEIKEICEQIYPIVKGICETEFALLKELHKARERRSELGAIVSKLQAKCNHEFMDGIRVCKICKFVEF